MKITFRRTLITVTLLAVAGVVVLVSGVIPVTASSGHWPITAWLLDYASDRSVDFHSNGIEVPPLDETGMVKLGAGTYQTNCIFCHGQPGKEQPPVAQGMTPQPPLLRVSMAGMSSEEKFYILKHGVKFAGMPAWPTQNRDDEIWPVVAFLNQLPEMSHQQYLKDTRVDPAETDNPIKRFVAEHCASCHGLDGNKNVNRRVPVLAGQNRAYLKASIQSFHDMTRHSGVMMPVAYHLTQSQINELAGYFANQSRNDSANHRRELKELDMNDLIDFGRQLAHEGDASAKIPSCVDCHGPGDWLRSDTHPRLTGQPAWYITRQLELFGQRKRGGSEAEIMHKIADKLDDRSRRALAIYYESAAMHEGDATAKEGGS
ncbi:c-type cytochrome [Stieleria varia]|uniref:Cytochrome c-552 n=1 Tax=Stieleria varia TaxID=2528005 RepID=A0A5C6B044_9BACT|nr:c-type cytochrome [Stieleria varia]TWU04941.1 Cytochrome c-552 precursor [Stieleria varia]